MGNVDMSELVTAKVAARMLGLKSVSNFRYHVKMGRIKPKTEVWFGKVRIPYYDPKDVEKLGKEIERNRELGHGGRPRDSK